MKRELRNKIIKYYNTYTQDKCLGLGMPCGHLCNLNKLCCMLKDNIKKVGTKPTGLYSKCNEFSKLPRRYKKEVFNMVCQAYLKNLIEVK